MCLSIFTAGVVVKVAALPALSVTVAVVVRPVPSPVTTAGLGVLVATPEKLSSVLYVNVTSPLFHPALLAAGLAESKAKVGAIVSTVIWTVGPRGVVAITVAAGVLT